MSEVELTPDSPAYTSSLTYTQLLTEIKNMTGYASTDVVTRKALEVYHWALTQGQGEYDVVAIQENDNNVLIKSVLPLLLNSSGISVAKFENQE